MTEAVFVAVVALRLLIPLGIPKYPLPFIIAALLLDGVDQTIFQAVDATSVLDNYQDYDKALDVYYLTIAYASTFRNWLDPDALAVARFLFYYRLAGTLAFELTGVRALLIIFPNTFEYFFIFYELVRLRWNPARMSRGLVIGAAAAIWICIKLPQEYWIHIAELDVTDEQAANPWLLPAFLAACALVASGLWPLRSRLPPADRTPDLHVDAYIDRPTSCAVTPRRDMNAILSVATAEKVLLLATIAVIFSQVLDGIRASSFQLVIGVGTIVTLNAVISLWRVERGSRYGSTVAQFTAMVTVNLAILGAGVLLRRTAGVSAYLPIADAAFFLLLISMVIAMYDRYRIIGNLSLDKRPRLRRRLRDMRQVAH
ncbi:hypothetical protein DSM112329_02535 [Paraconexibacter sp. AEG42_29]|uniref:Uncharacterized protein n=1 Tax=Paraconexibacter sp. AEG42_29 TaxID=2997339 RepID=A0AAU7AVK2_9ACTN